MNFGEPIASQEMVFNRLEEDHSIIMKDESSYCEFPCIQQHLATLQQLLLEYCWLPCQLVSLLEAAPCPCAGAGVSHSRQLSQECPRAPVNAMGAGGKDEPRPSRWVPEEGQLTLSLGRWGGSIPNFAAFFVGVERETRGILCCHPEETGCIQKRKALGCDFDG